MRSLFPIIYIELLFTEISHPSLPEEAFIQQRASAWNEVDEAKFGAVYVSGDLEDLATRYLNVFISGEMSAD